MDLMYPVELGRYLIQDHLSSIHILSYSHIFSRFGSFLIRGRHENSGLSRTGHAAEDARTGCHKTVSVHDSDPKIERL